MALSATYTINGEQKSTVWYAGTNTTELNVIGSFVTHLQADGEELQYLLRVFENIPRCNNHRLVYSWFGDHARFIAANIE